MDPDNPVALVGIGHVTANSTTLRPSEHGSGRPAPRDLRRGEHDLGRDARRTCDVRSAGIMPTPKKPVSNRPMPSTHKRAPSKPGAPPTPAPPPAMPKTHRAKPPEPVAVVDDGTRYRVRDKDFLKVWGEGLTKAEAEKLKLEVTSTNRSRTARVEPMTNPTPETDPVLASLQASARAASANAAAEANARQAERARRFAPAPTALAAAVEPIDFDEELATLGQDIAVAEVERTGKDYPPANEDAEDEVSNLSDDEVEELLEDIERVPALEEIAEPKPNRLHQAFWDALVRASTARRLLVDAGIASEEEIAAMTDKDVAELAAGLP